MSVLLETSIGDLVIDLDVKRAPKCSENFLKLCKAKKYNFCLVHSVQPHFVLQTGDPTATGAGGASMWHYMNGRRFFRPEIHPKLKHDRKGVVAMVTTEVEGVPLAASQFLITLSDSPIEYFDGKHAVFGHVAEGMEVLDKFNSTMVDEQNRPYRDIRIKHTIILDDPFDDPEGLFIPEESPEPTEEMLKTVRIGEDEEINPEVDIEAAEKQKREEEAAARALTLEMVGDLPFAEIKPPENVLFVCKLNPVTRDDDLEVIFSRFGPIRSCEILRDPKTGESLQYAFIEFENREDCEEAYFKMDNVLIDDRRIHVDFSQSVAKLHLGFMMGKKEPLEDGFGGHESLTKRRQYRQERRKEQDYDLVFEHEGTVHKERKREHPSDRHRSRSPAKEKKDPRENRTRDRRRVTQRHN